MSTHFCDFIEIFFNFLLQIWVKCVIMQKKQKGKAMKEISERIKSAIKNSGLSHRELETKTGIPHSAIQRYAAGTTDRIPIGRLEKLAIALGTTAEFLLGWETKEKPLDIVDNECKEMLALYKSLSKIKKKQALDYLRYLSTSSNNQ